MCKGGTGAIHPLFQAYHSDDIDTIRSGQYELGRGSDSVHFLANRRVDYSLTAAVPVSWPLTHAVIPWLGGTWAHSPPSW